tara:strand:+ start:2426 stop:4750 length:2325 start_codon:yes stop_codon:yes gene_type:complete
LLRSRALSAAIFLLLVGTFAAGSTSGQEVEEFGPGLELSIPQNHNIFLHGTEEIPELRRDWPILTGIPGGSASFSKTAGASENLVDVQGIPIVEALSLNGTVTVELYASLEAKSPVCRQTNVIPGSPAGATTQFFVTLRWGSFTLLNGMATNVVTMEESYTQSHIFQVEAPVDDVDLGPGDVLSLQISVQHDCVQPGSLWWGTYDAKSGITFSGDLIDPQLEQVTDSNRITRIEFTPISPWGASDFSQQVIEVVGPMDSYESMVHGFGQEDQRLEHFESPHSFRVGEANRTVLTWSTSKPLEPGLYMIDGCFKLQDQDPAEPCDVIGVLKFKVEEDPQALLSGTWVAIMIPLGVIAWLGASMREAMLPLPAYAVILVLAIASIGPAINLPDIDANAPRSDGAAPSFTLLEHGGDGSVSLFELLSDSDAVVVGLYVPGSANANRQANDFQMADALIDRDISFVQIATGEGVRAVDLDAHSELINGSWPLLMDNADSSVGKSFPSGASDAVIIIDAAGFITDWSPGIYSSSEIADAVEEATKGSGHSVFDPLTLLWGTALLPLFVLAMPRERKYQQPNEVLLPGSGVLLTLLAAGVGFSLWAIPISLMATFGFGAWWIWIELILAIILTYHGMRTLTSGRIPEMDWISNKIHSRLPEEYRDWRSASSFSDDLHLGIWVAWLIWLRTPDLVAQGVGAVARTGIFGIILSVFMLLGLILAAGLTVVIARAIIGITGPIPRTLGSLSVGIRPRAWGLASAMLGSWLLISLLVGPVLGNF